MTNYLHLQGKAASDYLKAKKRRAAQKVPQTKPIQLGFYQLDDGVGKVVTGAWLGGIELYKQDDGTYRSEGVFYGKAYPIIADIKNAGTIPLYRRFICNTEEPDPVQPVVNFLPWLEDYRLEKLTPEERAKLSAMTLEDTHDAEGKVVRGLHGIQIDYFHSHVANFYEGWTPWIDAVNSIMQNGNGINEEFPKQRFIVVPHYQDENGHKVVGADITLYVNGAKFVAGEGGVSYCNGATYKYFTWDAAMGIFPDGELHYPPQSPYEADD